MLTSRYPTSCQASYYCKTSLASEYWLWYANQTKTSFMICKVVNSCILWKNRFQNKTFTKRKTSQSLQFQLFKKCLFSKEIDTRWKITLIWLQIFLWFFCLFSSFCLTSTRAKCFASFRLSITSHRRRSVSITEACTLRLIRPGITRACNLLTLTLRSNSQN